MTTHLQSSHRLHWTEKNFGRIQATRNLCINDQGRSFSSIRLRPKVCVICELPFCPIGLKYCISLKP